MIINADVTAIGNFVDTFLLVKEKLFMIVASVGVFYLRYFVDIAEVASSILDIPTRTTSFVQVSKS